jgi:hypothetical protein
MTEIPARVLEVPAEDLHFVSAAWQSRRRAVGQAAECRAPHLKPLGRS